MTTPYKPLTCDGFSDALADYLEGDVSDSMRASIDAHAASCAACRQLLDDLNSIRVQAEALPSLAPSRDLWAGIAERIDTRIIPLGTPQAAVDLPRRRMWLRPAAAAAALVVVTAGVTHYITRATLSPVSGAAAIVATTASAPAVNPTAEFVSTATEAPVFTQASSKGRAAAVQLASAKPAIGEAEPVFASEISKLRKIVKERRSQLDPATVAVLERSISVIDSAITQSRAALAKDPASGFLATQLNYSLEKKVELLRTVATLPSRT